MSKKLHNSLVEFVVTSGFDQYTGLTSSNQTPQSLQKSGYSLNSMNIFEASFEPSILSVISHEKAYYPNLQDFNYDYPPIGSFDKDSSVNV